MSQVEFFSRSGQLFYRTSPTGPDQRFLLKGTNWFGLETSDFCLHGLWSANMEFLLDFLAFNKFNALRVPFSAELALELDKKVPGNCNYSANPDLKGLNSAQMMDKLIEKCAARGLLVLLDLHRVKAEKGIPELWYEDDDGFSEEQVIEAWRIMAGRYKNSWNVFAAELNNEPHGRASWGVGPAETDWRLGAERLGKAVQEVNPRLLILVEGVENNVCSCPGEGSWWGGHLGGAESHPVRLPVADKLVYSPHTYGPSVHMQPYFSDPTFPNNLPPIWERHFGCVKERKLGPAVVHTEWGGKAEGIDEVWQKAFGAWLVHQDMPDTFYWCLNPNSGDTGGLLLDDWKTPHQFKLQLLDAVVPNPTLFDGKGNVKDPGAPPTLGPFLAASLPKAGQVPPPATAQPPPTINQVAAGIQNVSLAATAAQPATPTPGPAPTPAHPAAAPAAVPKPNLPAPQEVVNGSLHMKVVAEDSWLDGTAEIMKYGCTVSNQGTTLVKTVALQVGGFAELQQSWCCTVAKPAAKAGDTVVLHLPDWLAAGLPAGQSYQAGLIMKLQPKVQPTFAVSAQ